MFFNSHMCFNMFTLATIQISSLKLFIIFAFSNVHYIITVDLYGTQFAQTFSNSVYQKGNLPGAVGWRAAQYSNPNSGTDNSGTLEYAAGSSVVQERAQPLQRTSSFA